MNYNKDLHIKDYALDIECLEQPKLLMKYTRLLAKAEKQVENLKDLREVIIAEIDKDIRMKPDDFDIDITKIKITEAVIKGALVMTPSYKEISKKLIKKNYDVRMLKGAINSINDRKSMLEALIKLHGQHYFAGPKVPRDLSYEVKQKHNQLSADKNIKIGKTRKRKGGKK